MGRVRGRFFTNRYELKRMNRDIRQEQEGHGTLLDWYHYQGAVIDPVYDEGGRRWSGPVKVNALSVVIEQGSDDPGSDSGRFVTDRIVVRASWLEITKKAIGTPNISIDFEQVYADRFVFRDHVYGVENITVDGHFDPEARDVIVVFTAGQLRPDELVTDVDFRAYAAR